MRLHAGGALVVCSPFIQGTVSDDSVITTVCKKNQNINEIVVLRF